MLAEDRFFKSLTEAELWQRYCGFLDLSIGDFMEIQMELLKEQLERVGGSLLGERILGKNPPRSIEEFRRRAPLTSYEDYEPYLSECREDALAEKPLLWCHSSGRGGKFKWVPHSEAFMNKTTRNSLASCILSSTVRKGEINIAPGFRFLTTLPPVPYTSGALLAHWRRRFTFRPIPPPEAVEGLPFAEHIKKGFRIALREGFDVAGSIASVLVRMGEQMSDQAEQKRKLTWSMLHPRVLFRLLRGQVLSRRARRPMMPRDLWSPKGIIAGGLDLDIYRQDIERYWGIRPFNVYASTETMFLAMQAWNKKTLTFVPDSVFLEFIRHDGSDPASAAEILLLDELEAGRLYELVITQLHGMPLLRYRLGDVIRVVSPGDEEAGVKLPQIAVQRRVGETIKLAALCNLDERTIWKAIAATGIRYTDWTALKEYERNRTFLRLVIELKEPLEASQVCSLVDEQLKQVDTDYIDMDHYLGVNPVRTTILSEGAFARYAEAKANEGADLAQLKPAHINPSNEMLKLLLGLGGVKEKE